MGLFDGLFATTETGPGGWETTTTPANSPWGTVLGKGMQGAIKGFQSPFEASKLTSGASAAPGAPAAQSPQMNLDAVMASLNRMPTSPAAAGKGKSSGIIWGPFGPAK